MNSIDINKADDIWFGRHLFTLIGETYVSNANGGKDNPVFNKIKMDVILSGFDIDFRMSGERMCSLYFTRQEYQQAWHRKISRGVGDYRAAILARSLTFLCEHYKSPKIQAMARKFPILTAGAEMTIQNIDTKYVISNSKNKDQPIWIVGRKEFDQLWEAVQDPKLQPLIQDSLWDKKSLPIKNADESKTAKSTHEM